MQFNGIERVDALGVGYDMAFYRGLDPVLGKWHQVDPKAEQAGFHMSPYCAMGNNPIIHTDPDGDILPAILIGAAIGIYMNGVTNTLRHENPFNGWWKSAMTGSIGGALSSFGGGSLINDVIWGAVEGGVTGSIGAGLNGENIAMGLLKGALVGGISTFAFNLTEVLKNAREGCGFNTNVAIFKNQIDNSVLNGEVSWSKVIDAFQYYRSRFGGPTLYKGILPWGMTDPFNGKIYLGKDVIVGGGDMVLNTINHETAHYFKSIEWINGAGSRGTGRVIEEGLDIIENHGTIGYYDAIRSSGKSSISLSTMRGYGKNNIQSELQNKAWNSFGSKKWWYLIPKRF
jgi:RHS repeat-associated protein